MQVSSQTTTAPLVSTRLWSFQLGIAIGVPVIRIKGRRSGTFGGIWLTRSEKSIDVVKHERGHSTQLMMMGLATFVFTVAIPSAACLGHHFYREGDSPEINYYRTPWETLADLLGGAGFAHCRSEKKTAWIYYGLSFLILPAVIFWR